MEPALMLAIIVAVYIIVARGIAFIDPKFQKKLWRMFVKRPDHNVERMGFVFIGVAGIMVYFALPEIVSFSGVIILVAAGWLLCMGALATQVKPVKSMSQFFAKKSDDWVRLTSIVFVILGFLILYMILSL